MIQFFLKIWKYKLHLQVQVWAYDACMNEHVVFEFVFGKLDESWNIKRTGFSSRWLSCGNDGCLTWSFHRRGKETGWRLRGPLTRI